LLNELGKFCKKVGGIIRSGRSLWVILHRECGQFFVTEPLDGIIVEVDVGDLNVVWKRINISGKSMVLSGNGYFAITQVFDRLVASTVTKFEFVGAASKCVGEYLVTETDAKNWSFAEELFNFGMDVI